MVRGMVGGVQQHQRSPDAFLLAAGIAPQLLNLDGARITNAQYIELFRQLIAQLGDEMLGFLSQPVKRGALELLVRSTLGSRDLEGALQRFCRGFAVLQDEVALTLVRDGAQAGLCIQLLQPGNRPHFLHEFLLRVTWRLAAWLAGGSLKVQRFDFAFAEPPHVVDYARVFPARLNFGQSTSAFWFDARHLSRAFGRDQAAVQAFLASLPASVIAPRLESEGIAARVRAHLLHTVPKWPGLTALAKALHVSAPTLQRQLAAANTSCQTLKDELRRDLAISRLATSAVSFGQLADELGFSSAAGFQRAFKTWTGSTPGLYRARLLRTAAATP